VLTPFRPRQGEEGGIVAINLVLFLGFALYAVVQLTRTTLAAQQIDERVVVITKEVGPIDQNLNEVPKLDLTNATAAKIRTAADPLTGEAQEIITAAQSIDGTVDGINANAVTINGTVKQIAGSVGSISSSVGTIGSNVGTLTGTVGQIRGGVAAINGRVDVIIGLATAIEGDLSNVNSVVGNGSPFFNGTKSIQGHAATICRDLGAGC